MQLFTPAMNPSQSGTSGQQTARLLVAQFGDGYKQSIPDGLNTAPVMFSLAWNSLLVADANNILSFFRTHQGQSFYYQIPGEGAARAWQCGSWSWNYLSAEVMAVTATFEEHFDLG